MRSIGLVRYNSSMSWAGRRRALIISVAGAILLVVLSLFSFVLFYTPPTCIDHKQNQDEGGIDCGGSCTTLCAFQVGSAPAIALIRPLAPQPGRVDVVAYIENRNTNAQAEDAPFLLEVFGSDQQLIAKRTILVDLPISSTVPVYVADVAPRGSVASRAFLTPLTDDIVWKRATAKKPVLPLVESVSVTEGERPRISATLVNPLAIAIYGTILIATVYDASGNIIAASQTLVPTLPSQGTSPLVFTWNAPWNAPMARYDVRPVPTLPPEAP